MSTQHRAPMASARASPSVTVFRLALRFPGSASRRLTQRPTSAITTPCFSKASARARILGLSSRATAGQ